MVAKKAKGRPKRPAGNRTVTRRPRDFEKAVSAAYLRMLGYPDLTQKQAAEQVGISERSLREWEAGDWWPDAQKLARERWLRGGDAKTMQAINRALDSETEYATMARYWADRRLPELHPPVIRQRLDAEVDVDLNVKDERAEIASLLAGLAAEVKAAKDSK